MTAAKIKNGSISNTKLADGSVSNTKLVDGSVTTGKLANGAVTGAKINAGSTGFSQVVARLRGGATLPFTGSQVYPLNNPTYTQPPGEDDQFIGGLDVNFPASCTQPRQAQAYLELNSANPAAPNPGELIGLGVVYDTQSGAVTRRLNFGPFPGGGAMNSLESSTPQSQTFSILLVGASCSSGSGVTASGAGVDVIGTK